MALLLCSRRCQFWLFLLSLLIILLHRHLSSKSDDYSRRRRLTNSMIDNNGNDENVNVNDMVEENNKKERFVHSGKYQNEKKEQDGVVEGATEEEEEEATKDNRLDNDSSSSSTTDLIWASGGGGWRAMVGAMGFANVLGRKQMGILGGARNNGNNKNKINLHSISVNSGSAWFALQLFYSKKFYKKTITSTPKQLASFVNEWMGSYIDLLEEATAVSETSRSLCTAIDVMFSSSSLPSELSGIDLKEFCKVLGYYKGDWALFIQDMLNATSTIAYDDPDFSSRKAGSDDRIRPMRNTNMHVQMTITPNTRTSTLPKENRMLNYLTPAVLGPRRVFAVPLAMQYVVGNDENDSYHYKYAVEDEYLPFGIVTSLETAPVNFNARDYSDDYYTYPAENNGNERVYTSVSGTTRDPDRFRTPFTTSITEGIPPTVVQVAAVSSAAMGIYTGSVPSVLSQMSSAYEYDDDGSFLDNAIDKATIAAATNTLYRSPWFNDVAVCSQWPNPCTEYWDGRLIDGLYSGDGPTLALTLGQYFQANSGNNRKKKNSLKVVLTIYNYGENGGGGDEDSNNNVNFLAYFSTTFNQNVEPGEFLWAPSRKVPWRSPQIFQDTLTAQKMESQRQPIKGTSLTYIVLNDLITIDNAAYGVQPGFMVDLMVVEINSDVPSVIVGAGSARLHAKTLADTAEEIAGSEQLITAIEEFVSSG